jgi:predicted DNA-binding ribbon-helix-helix protein
LGFLIVRTSLRLQVFLLESLVQVIELMEVSQLILESLHNTDIVNWAKFLHNFSNFLRLNVVFWESLNLNTVFFGVYQVIVFLKKCSLCVTVCLPA